MPHKDRGRPPSGTNRPRLHNGGPEPGSLRKGDDTNVVSYEDLIIAQYLEELKKTPPYTKKTSPGQMSPYLQRLPHTDIIPTPLQVKSAMKVYSRPSSGKMRPHSATSPGRSGTKPRIDARFIADPGMWDPATPREAAGKGRQGRRRPVSAPSRKTRPLSAASRHGYRTTGYRRFKPVYAQQPPTIVTTAFKNGTRDTFFKMAAPSIKVLLEMCTDKLGLNSAARRVFLEDGSEVFESGDIPRDAEIYISQGETFKNPYTQVKQQTLMQKSASWTINGLVLPIDNKRGVTKSLLSKRFKQSCIDKARRRILVFRNGVGGDGGYEIVTDLDKPQEFLNACTGRMSMGSHARILYNWEGKEIYDLYDTPVLDACLQAGSTPVLGPLWVSKGEGFSPKGAKDFLVDLITHVKGKLKEAKHYKKQLVFAGSETEKYKVEIAAILSMNEQELAEATEVVNKDMEDWTNALNRLKEQMKKIEEKAQAEESQGVDYTMQHIKSVDTSDRLVGELGIKLKVYENGTYDNEDSVYFNVSITSKEVGGDKMKIMHRLLDLCTARCRLANAPALSVVGKKLYDKTGQEVSDPFKLKDEQELWLSFGEAFRQSFVLCLQAVFDKVKGYNMFAEKNVAVREQLLAEDISQPGSDSSSSWDASIGFPMSYDFKDITADSDPVERDHVETMVKMSEVNVNSTFLQNKDDGKLLLYPDLMIDTKKKKVPTATLR